MEHKNNNILFRRFIIFILLFSIIFPLYSQENDTSDIRDKYLDEMWDRDYNEKVESKVWSIGLSYEVFAGLLYSVDVEGVMLGNGLNLRFINYLPYKYLSSIFFQYGVTIRSVKDDDNNYFNMLSLISFTAGAHSYKLNIYDITELRFHGGLNLLNYSPTMDDSGIRYYDGFAIKTPLGVEAFFLDKLFSLDFFISPGVFIHNHNESLESTKKKKVPTVIIDIGLALWFYIG